MSRPVISIIVSSYNRLPYLRLSIQSIREELFDISYQIIVIDNGSYDGTLEWLAQQKDIITIVQHNHGEWLGLPVQKRSWGDSMNIALKVAAGIYVTILSDRCLIVPGALRNGIDVFDAQRIAGRRIGGVAFHWRLLPEQQMYQLNYTIDNRFYVMYGIYLNSALQDVSYIDEEYLCSDYGLIDLSLKLWQKAYEIIQSPDSYIECYPAGDSEIQKTDSALFIKKWTIEDAVIRTEKDFYDQSNTGQRFNDVHKSIKPGEKNVFLDLKLDLKSVIKKIAQKASW